MNIQLEKTLAARGDYFRQFSRNGRWGTCADCPRNYRGDVFPELCIHTDRDDHHLNAKTLADSWDSYFKGNAQWISTKSPVIPPTQEHSSGTFNDPAIDFILLS